MNERWWRWLGTRCNQLQRGPNRDMRRQKRVCVCVCVHERFWASRTLWLSLSTSPLCHPPFTHSPFFLPNFFTLLLPSHDVQFPLSFPNFLLFPLFDHFRVEPDSVPPCGATILTEYCWYLLSLTQKGTIRFLSHFLPLLCTSVTHTQLCKCWKVV